MITHQAISLHVAWLFLKEKLHLGRLPAESRGRTPRKGALETPGKAHRKHLEELRRTMRCISSHQDPDMAAPTSHRPADTGEARGASHRCSEGPYDMIRSLTA